MAESSPIISGLLKANAVSDNNVSRLVEAVLDGSTERASLADGYAVDLAAAVEASAFAKSVLANKDSAPATRRSAARTAIPLARAEKA